MVDNTQLQTMIDRMGISDTVMRYAASLDIRDWDAFRSCFTEEVDIDLTSFREDDHVRSAADAFVERVRTRISKNKATQHLSTNHIISINGDEATCISCLHARHYYPSQTGDHCFVQGGYYTYTLVRTPQGWKIRKMKQTVTWTEGDRALYDMSGRLV